MGENGLLKNNKNLGNSEYPFGCEKSDNTPNALMSNLRYQSLPDERKRLILDIVGNECVDEESLNLLIGKTKEELESIKEDKNFILDVTGKKKICITDLMDLREFMSKNYEKFIFDLDGTLLIPDWSCEDDYLKKNVALEEQEDFFSKKQDILNKYEDNFPKYDIKTLSDYFKEYGFNISEDVIDGWMRYNGENIKDEVADGVVELFKYLKENGKKIIVLTNWFSKTQIPRLERSGLIEYVDGVVAGDSAMKPSVESFDLAVGETDKKDCLMVGDSFKSDKLGAKNAKIHCCIVGKGYSIRNLFDIIRKSGVMEKTE